MRALVRIMAFGVALAAAPLRAEVRDTASVLGGRMTDNTWEDILFETGNVVARDSFLAGVAVAREWPFSGNGALGVEVQLVRHVGEQDHWELSAPVYVRAPRPERAFLPSLSYGLGLSWASARPEIEIDRRDDTRQLLLMWFIDLEFNSRGDAVRPFMRLHHRSDGFGVIPVDTGSNAVLLGLRHDF